MIRFWLPQSLKENAGLGPIPHTFRNFQSILDY
jgi:hypothetical protein